MKLHYFSWLRTRLGIFDEEVSFPNGMGTMFDLIQILVSRGDEFEQVFSKLSMIKVAINDEVVSDYNQPINEKDVVTFFAPMAGG